MATIRKIKSFDCDCKLSDTIVVNPAEVLRKNQEREAKEKEIEARKKEIEEREKEVEEKLQYYESQCKRYGLLKVKSIQKCIKELPGYEICNLNHYGIRSLQCQVVFETFSKPPVTQLTSISLKNNQLESFCCHPIASFIEISLTLKELNLDGCKFDVEGVKILSEGLSNSKSIIHFSLANCYIPDEGVEAIAKSFRTNDVCKELNLSSNLVGFKTATMLGKVLMVNETLEKLDLSYNSLYDEGAIVNILKGLAQNETLMYLDLSWNSLCGEPVTKNLAKAIKDSKLKILKIEHNRMSTFELKKLRLGLRRSRTIEEVYMADNMFCEDDDFDLLKVFKSKTSLKVMSFGKWFHLSRDAYEMLKEIRIFKPHVQVIFNSVTLPNPPREVNILDVLADRVKYLALKPKKEKDKRDMSFFMNQLRKFETSHLAKEDWIKMINKFRVNLDNSLIDQYCEAFAAGTVKFVNVHQMAEHYLNRYPYVSVKAQKKLKKLA